MSFDQVDQVDALTVFGSSRDSAPTAVLGQHTPAGAVWVRTLVVADNLGTAVAWLEAIHLVRPIETLEQTEGGDWIAQAVARHSRTIAVPEFHALVFLAAARHPDLGRPTVYELNMRHTGWAEIGYVGTDAGGPRIMPAPDAFIHTDQLIPLHQKG